MAGLARSPFGSTGQAASRGLASAAPRFAPGEPAPGQRGQGGGTTSQSPLAGLAQYVSSGTTRPAPSAPVAAASTAARGLPVRGRAEIPPAPPERQITPLPGGGYILEEAPRWDYNLQRWVYSTKKTVDPRIGYPDVALPSTVYTGTQAAPGGGTLYPTASGGGGGGGTLYPTTSVGSGGGGGGGTAAATPGLSERERMELEEAIRTREFERQRQAQAEAEASRRAYEDRLRRERQQAYAPIIESLRRVAEREPPPLPSRIEAPPAPSPISLPSRRVGTGLTPEEEEAQRAAYAGARERIGLETQGALRSAMERLGATGNVGAISEATGAILAGGAGQLAETNRLMALERARRAGEISDQEYQAAVQAAMRNAELENAYRQAVYQGAITQRAQDIGAAESYQGRVPSLLGLLLQAYGQAY